MTSPPPAWLLNAASADAEDSVSERLTTLLLIDAPTLCACLDTAHRDSVSLGSLWFIAIDQISLVPSLLMSLLALPHYRVASPDDQRLWFAIPRLAAADLFASLDVYEKPLPEKMIADLGAEAPDGIVRLLFLDFDCVVWAKVDEARVRACCDTSQALSATVASALALAPIADTTDAAKVN